MRHVAVVSLVCVCLCGLSLRGQEGRDVERNPLRGDKEAIAAGHKLGWLWAGRIRQHKRNGWKPVTERTKLGLPSIFMDRNKELILMSKPGEPQKSS